MQHPVIKVQNLSKHYRIGEIGGYKTLREAIVNLTKAPFNSIRSKAINNTNPPIQNTDKAHIWALKDVSLNVQKGEIVGIIGRNGAGKSTFLKILSKITDPTDGRVELRGRVGSLLEVGTGFHPELTGHENIYLYGAILGMDRYEVTRKFNEIVKFAELDKFIETPVKRYSSGMYMRLAFAVAAFLEPEIMLIDEVLAVGDAEFQKKCIGKMGDVADSGRTVIFVSHNMEAVRQLCQRTVLFEDGRISMDGDTEGTIKEYLSVGQEKAGGFREFSPESAPGDEYVRLHSVKLKNRSGEVSTVYQIDEGITIEVEYNIIKPISNYHTSFRIFTQDGILICASGDWDYNRPQINNLLPGRYKAICTIPGDLLNWGIYCLTVIGLVPNVRYVYTADTVVKWEISQIGGAGGVFSRNRDGILRPRLKWQISREDSIS